jgi:hypothetical protein
MELLRQVLARAFPVDVVQLGGSLGDIRQRVDAVIQRSDLSDEAAEMLRASLSHLQRIIDEIHELASIPARETPRRQLTLDP